jgi:hypothetical protein
MYQKVLEAQKPSRVYYVARNGALLYEAFYGVRVKFDALKKYASANALRGSRGDNFSVAQSVTFELSFLCSAPLRLVRIVPNNSEFAIALYSNYNAYKRRLPEKDEQEVLSIIQEELGCDVNTMWFYPLH